MTDQEKRCPRCGRPKETVAARPPFILCSHPFHSHTPPTTSAEGEERVTAAFPATGKSFVAAHDHRFIDSDSSRFSWGPDGDRHPNWPSNYIAHIRGALANGDRVLVSTHGEVRKALADASIPFTLVYPKHSLRDEYRARMEKRGSPPALIAKVIDELWHDALSECVNQQGCEHIVLGPGQYLADVLLSREPDAKGHPPCAFGPEGEHHDGELVCCDECGRPTCDYCGFGHNDEESDWLCPECRPSTSPSSRQPTEGE